MTNPLTDEVIDKAVDAYEKCYLGFDLETREKMRAPDTECMRAAAKVIESALAGDGQSKPLPKIPGHILLLSLRELHDWLDARSRCEEGISRTGCDLAARSLKAAIKGKSHE